MESPSALFGADPTLDDMLAQSTALIQACVDWVCCTDR